MNELQDTLEEIMKIFKCQEYMLDILESEKSQNNFREAKTKADCINGAMAALPICAVILKCSIQKSPLFDSLK